MENAPDTGAAQAQGQGLGGWRAARLLGLLVLALASSATWIGRECSDAAAAEVGAGELWPHVLCWALGCTLPAYAAGAAAAWWLGVRLNAWTLALAALTLAIAACGLQWNILAPAFLLGVLGGIGRQKLCALTLLLLAGCVIVYAVNAACVLVGGWRASEGLTDGSLAAENVLEIQVGDKHWRGCPVAAPVPFFFAQDVLLMQQQDGAFRFLYGGHRSSTPEWPKGGQDYASGVNRHRYHRLY